MRWRRFSPIDREWPIYELTDGDVSILNVTKGDDLSLEIAFHEGASGRIFDLATIERLLSEVKVLLAADSGS